MAVTGFVLSLISAPFYWIGILPLLGIIFSAIGLGTVGPEQRGRALAAWGLGLSILWLLLCWYMWGHWNGRW
jgi:hypothetical protein